MDIKDKRVHRVLIFHGGGAMGAYEAGVFEALHEKMYDDSDGYHHMFNVVGASIGAVNAVLLVTVLKNNGSWKNI